MKIIVWVLIGIIMTMGACALEKEFGLDTSGTNNIIMREEEIDWDDISGIPYASNGGGTVNHRMYLYPSTTEAGVAVSFSSDFYYGHDVHCISDADDCKWYEPNDINVTAIYCTVETCTDTEAYEMHLIDDGSIVANISSGQCGSVSNRANDTELGVIIEGGSEVVMYFNEAVGTLGGWGGCTIIYNYPDEDISTIFNDTNADTECDGTNVYLDGEGNCDIINRDSTGLWQNNSDTLMPISGYPSALNVTGDIYGDNIVLTGNILSARYWYHLLDVDTFINFPEQDVIEFDAGGISFLRLEEYPAKDTIYLNPDEADMEVVVGEDLRVEGNINMSYGGEITLGNGNALYLDPSEDVMIVYDDEDILLDNNINSQVTVDGNLTITDTLKFTDASRPLITVPDYTASSFLKVFGYDDALIPTSTYTGMAYNETYGVEIQILGTRYLGIAIGGVSIPANTLYVNSIAPQASDTPSNNVNIQDLEFTTCIAEGSTEGCASDTAGEEYFAMGVSTSGNGYDIQDVYDSAEVFFNHTDAKIPPLAKLNSTDIWVQNIRAETRTTPEEEIAVLDATYFDDCVELWSAEAESCGTSGGTEWLGYLSDSIAGAVGPTFDAGNVMDASEFFFNRTDAKITSLRLYGDDTTVVDNMTLEDCLTLSDGYDICEEGDLSTASGEDNYVITSYELFDVEGSLPIGNMLQVADNQVITGTFLPIRFNGTVISITEYAMTPGNCSVLPYCWITIDSHTGSETQHSEVNITMGNYNYTNRNGRSDADDHQQAWADLEVHRGEAIGMRCQAGTCTTNIDETVFSIDVLSTTDDLDGFLT